MTETLNRPDHDATALPKEPAGAAPDPVVTGASQALGGAPGRRALSGRRRFWSPIRWLILLTLLTSVLGFWQKAPCRVHPWAENYQYTRVCYTDIFALYNAEDLSSRATPYLDHPVEYPVVIGAAMALANNLADRVIDVVGDPRLAAPQRDLQRAQAAVRDGSGNPAAVANAQQAYNSAVTGVRNTTFFDVSWALLTLCAVVGVVTTARLAGRRRVWDAAMFAVAPTLLLHATTNWDLIAVAFAGLGLLAWARQRPVLAGVLLGLGTATKLYPVIFLVPLLALCWRAGRLRAGLATSAALVATAALVTLPVYLTAPSFADLNGHQQAVAASPLDRLGSAGLAALAPHTTVLGPGGTQVTGVNAVYRFVELNRTRTSDWDSLQFALQTVRGHERTGPAGAVLDTLGKVFLDDPPGDGDPAPNTVNLWVAAGLVLTLAAVVLLALLARRRPRLPQLLFLALVGFLLTNKVFSPQYTLWLLPLAILARPRWRPFLAWQAAEAFLLFTRFYFFIWNDTMHGKGIDVGWFLGAVLVRDAALVLLAAAVVRDVLRPEVDVVRQPAGSIGPAEPRAADDLAGKGAADDLAGTAAADDLAGTGVADDLAGTGVADDLAGMGAPDDPAGGLLDHAPDRRGRYREQLAEPAPVS